MSLADQLGDCIRPVGHRHRVDADRFTVAGPPSAHDMIRAREDEPLDPRQGRGVKHVRQSVKVRPDQIVPGCEFVGVGRQVNDGVDPVEVRDPFIVQDLKISRDISGSSGSATRSMSTRS